MMGEKTPKSRQGAPTSPSGASPRLETQRDSQPGSSRERLLIEVVELAPDAVVIVGTDGRIELVNRQTETLFGYTRAELLGEKIESLIPKRFETAHHRHRDQYIAEPRMRPMGAALELFGRRKDGSEFPVEVSLSPIVVEGQQYVIGAIRDVSDRKALEAALRETEERIHRETAARLALWQTILDQIPVGVYLVRGSDARLVLANRAVATIWGAKWPEGQPLEAFLREVGTRVYAMSGQPIAGDELATLRALRTHVSALHQQEVLHHRDGTTLPVLVNSIPLDTDALPDLAIGGNAAEGNAAGAPPGPDSLVLVVHEDVTALRETERLKDEFVAMAAHELRNPMGTLSVYGSMLRRGSLRQGSGHADLADWQLEALDGIEQVTRHLVSLTDDLLDVTKLQAGGFWMHIEPHDLSALVRRVVARMQQTTEQHHLLLTGADQTLVVEIDVRRMEQVITNLLNNAIKYSPAGGDITVSLTRNAADSDETVDLAVRDAGIGIAAEDQPHIFGRFARGANARELQIEGSGLGLYLCHELIERQNGHIWFESTAGAGSTFSIRLPMSGD